MVAPKEYNADILSEFFELSETSPSGLVWKIDRSQKTKLGDSAGWKNYKRCGTPSGWRVELNKKNYYVHRVIWILLNGDIPNGYVINHIDTNPFNNKIENLELCIYADNIRKNKTFVRNATYKNNKTGITGVHVNKNNLVMATWRDEYGNVRNKGFSISKYGYDQAIELATECRDYNIDRLRQLGFNYPIINKEVK